MNALVPIEPDEDDAPDEYDRWCANCRRSTAQHLRRLKRVFGADLGRLSGGGTVATAC